MVTFSIVSSIDDLELYQLSLHNENLAVSLAVNSTVISGKSVLPRFLDYHQNDDSFDGDDYDDLELRAN